MTTLTYPPATTVTPANVGPSTRPGMGAIPYQTGVTFRVWAPNVHHVYIAGDFNNWSQTANPLYSHGNGYWSVDVENAQIGQEYKFVLSQNHIMKNDPYARKLTHSDGNSIITDDSFDWQGDSFRLAPWNELVIYEMHIGTFNDEPGGHPGDLNRAIEKLNHLKDLGINAIEVMPSTEFTNDFSWGYNPAYIFSIESAYGGPEAFKEFIKQAHQNNIAVILDIVYNHLGPDSLDLWQFDGWQQNNKGGIYFYNDRRSWTKWGDTRPDYGRPEVRQYLRDNALKWLEEYHLDGLRFDATAFIRNIYGNNNDPSNDIHDGWTLMQRINNEVKQKYPWKIKIAEDMRNNQWITKETNLAGAGFDSQWNARFVDVVRNTLITPNDHERDMHALRDVIYERYSSDAFEKIVFTESHDEVAKEKRKTRLPQAIWPGNPGSWYSKKRSTLGAAIVFTVPGIPMIFQGQEILEDQWFRDDAPIDWSKTYTYGGICMLYKDLIRLRRNWYDDTRGLRGQHVNVFHVNNNDKMLAYHRWQNGGPMDDVIIILNLANHVWQNYCIGFPRAGIWKVRFNSDWRGYDRDFANCPGHDTQADNITWDNLPSSALIDIGPYSALILSQDS